MRHDSLQSLWKTMIYHRWQISRERPVTNRKMKGSVGQQLSYRDLYVEKRRADAEAIGRLRQMASVLQNLLQLSETQRMAAIGNPHIGQAWDHHCWSFLLRNRDDAVDILKATARRYLGDASISVYEKLLGFLAARCIQDFHFADCLQKWKVLTEKNKEIPFSHVQSLQLKQACSLEEFVLLLCDIQKTPLELLQDDSDYTFVNMRETDFEANELDSLGSQTTKTLDEIASKCMEEINMKLEANASVTSKLQVVSEVLVNYYGFSGNSKDYYNYHNVLLDRVVESKTGMPLTLCLIYSCICRRIGIAVQLTGLPGHIVLGFDTDDVANATEDRRSFIDVFHGCRILSTDDCKQIVASYGIGWREDFLTPLSTKMTLQRIFNNLQNCHAKAMGRSNPPSFQSDLMFQQHTLSMVHRYPPEIANTLLDRLTQDLSIILSPDLLRAYGLLSARGSGIDPVVNTTHARVLLELSSYVGLSYHNYA